MCPDWESNRQPFGSQASTQSTEPHQPGLLLLFPHSQETKLTLKLLSMPKCTLILLAKICCYLFTSVSVAHRMWAYGLSLVTVTLFRTLKVVSISLILTVSHFLYTHMYVAKWTMSCFQKYLQNWKWLLLLFSYMFFILVNNEDGNSSRKRSLVGKAQQEFYILRTVSMRV